MHFIALCTDRPGGLDIRMQHRPEHLAWLEANKARVLLAGPFLDAAGQMNGSMLVIEAADEADAKAFLGGDPFAKAGLFSASEVKPWRRTFGAAL